VWGNGGSGSAVERGAKRSENDRGVKNLKGGKWGRDAPWVGEKRASQGEGTSVLGRSKCTNAGHRPVMREGTLERGGGGTA